MEPSYNETLEHWSVRQMDKRYCSLLPYDDVVQVGGHHTGPRGGHKSVRGWGWDRTGVTGERTEEDETVQVVGKGRRRKK